MRLPADIVGRIRQRLEGVGVCVTGGAGFIGGHLVDALISVGAHVTVIDDLSNSAADHLGELIDLDPERIRFVDGSILDDEAMEEAVRGGGARRQPARIIFHLAALGSVARSVAEPQRTWSVNATGTVRVLEAARAAQCGRVVFSSSSSVYGGGGESARVETMAPAPVSPYAASKVAGEAAMQAWARAFGLSTVSLRLFNIFGPRQPAKSAYAAVVPAFAKRLLAGEPPLIHGDGKQTRDFTYVASAVVALLQAGTTERPLAGEILNIGSGSRISVLSLARKMAEACGGAGGIGVAPPEPVAAPERPGDVRHSLADISRAREVLGYEPIACLDDGLAETVAWYRGIYVGA